MTCLTGASRPIATCLGVFWFAAIIACLHADAFVIGPQQQCLGGGSLRAAPLGGGASMTQLKGERLQRKAPGIPRGVASADARNSSMQLRAESDTGGENGGPILLVRRPACCDSKSCWSSVPVNLFFCVLLRFCFQYRQSAQSTV